MAAIKSVGELKFRVRFDKEVHDDTDPAGGSTKGWREQFTRWAAIRRLQGSEPVLAQRLTGVQPVLIIVRYDSDTVTIDASWRAVEMRDGKPVKYYGLRSVEDMESEREFLTIMAEAGVADA